MSEPLQTANNNEPDPIPSNVSGSAPIRGDIERGYYTRDDDEIKPESIRSPTIEQERKGSVATVVGDSPTADGKKSEKAHGSGLTAGDEDMDEIPKNNLWVVMPAIGLVLFLAALDQTIVATALPRIAEELNATPSEYSWVGTSYMLAMTILVPVNGRVSDIVGRKPLLYVAIIDFTIFSALCGAAKSMQWLIICRAFQGLGGGSIIGLANIVTADITPLKTRGMWQGFIGGTWGIASVLGPILGGLLTDRATWRWTFSGIAFFFLLFTLKLNPRKKLTFAELKRTFDFIGLLLIMLAGGLLVVGFSEAADFGFDKPKAYAVIIVGAVLFVCAIIHFLTTKRNAIVPARMFKNRTTLLFLISSTLHALAFLPANYLLPQQFQGVGGADALQSGIDLLPFACCVAWATVVAGIINSKLRIVRPVAWVGYAMAGLGFALFYAFFTYPIPYATQEGLQVLAGFGVGLSLSVPILILQAAMPLKEMAAATAAWSLTRAVGGSIGLAIFTATLNSSLRSKFAEIPGFGTTFDVPTSAAGYRALHEIQDSDTKTAVLVAFSDSLKLCWIINAALFFACLLISLPTRSYSLRRTGGPKRPSQSEQGTTDPSGISNSVPVTEEEGKNLPTDEHHQSHRGITHLSDEATPTPISERTLVDRSEFVGRRDGR